MRKSYVVKYFGPIPPRNVRRIKGRHAGGVVSHIAKYLENGVAKTAGISIRVDAVIADRCIGPGSRIDIVLCEVCKTPRSFASHPAVNLCTAT